MSDTHIRRAQVTEHAAPVNLWERSVRGTHDFLGETDIVHLRPHVAEYFAGSVTDIRVLTDEEDVQIGFLGLAGDDKTPANAPPTVGGVHEHCRDRPGLIRLAGIAKQAGR